MIFTLEVKLFTLKDKICAWEFFIPETQEFNAGGARPFKRSMSLDTVLSSEFFSVPYTKKQLKSFDYIADKRQFFEEMFFAADVIQPYEKYDNALKQTFGPTSQVYKLYEAKALEPRYSANKAELYIDFEAMNMRICGWYAQLVDGDNMREYSGLAKPYSDERRVRWLWKNTYSKMLPYEYENIAKAKYIHGYKNYFIDMFSKAKRIYTYGDTDALFIKYSFGDELYNFFKVKNVDVSVKLGNRTISLDNACKLFNVTVEGDSHDPKNDVLKMRAYMDASKEI